MPLHDRFPCLSYPPNVAISGSCAGPTPIAYVDSNAAELASHLRARYAIRLPDALQLAVAVQHGSAYFVTNDIRLKKANESRVLALEDYA